MSDFKSDIHDCEGMQFWRDQCAKVDAALREEHARLTDTERQLREAQERAEHLESELAKTQDAYEAMKRQKDAEAAFARRQRERAEKAERQLREAQERCERLENVGRLLQEWVDGIVADFDGVTDDANDPQRLHTWDDLERCERRLPISMPPSPNPTK